jgi:hypothetical protein
MEAMSNESATGESKSEQDVWRKLFWTFSLGGSIALLYYEYLWSLFAFQNPATVSFGWWFWTALAIMTPWDFCFICLIELRKGVRNGSVGRDVSLKISVWAEMVMLSAYWMLASEIHRLTTLGVLK